MGIVGWMEDSVAMLGCVQKCCLFVFVVMLVLGVVNWMEDSVAMLGGLQRCCSLVWGDHVAAWGWG